MKMDPKTQMYISAVMAVLTVLASSSTAWPDGVPPHVVHAIQSWNAFLLQIWAVIVPVLFGISSAQAGPLSSDKGKPNG